MVDPMTNSRAWRQRSYRATGSNLPQITRGLTSICRVGNFG